jgi:MFS family permease
MPIAAQSRNLRPPMVVAQGAAALAVSMGIGRFVYTPILPLMVREAGLSKSFGAALATANYAGYLLGALAGIVAPGLVRSTGVMRVALLASVATLALMPATHDHAAWFVLRFVAGGASALVFMFVVSAMLSHLRPADHLVGWGVGGVGAGIALSGVLVLITGSISTWSAAWWSSAVAALVLCGVAWRLTPPEPEGRASVAPNPDGPPVRRWFTALFAAYSLEGIGYIIAGTFLVAAIGQNSPEWAGTAGWIRSWSASAPFRRRQSGRGSAAVGPARRCCSRRCFCKRSASACLLRSSARPTRRGAVRVDFPRHRVAVAGPRRPPAVPACHRASDHGLQRRPDPRAPNRQATATQRVPRRLARRLCRCARRRTGRRRAASRIPTPRRRGGRAIPN